MDTATLQKLTRAVRRADAWFNESGGGSRHWVRECFLVALAAEGLAVVDVRAERANTKALRALMESCDLMPEVLLVEAGDAHDLASRLGEDRTKDLAAANAIAAGLRAALLAARTAYSAAQQQGG